MKLADVWTRLRQLGTLDGCRLAALQTEEQELYRRLAAAKLLLHDFDRDAYEVFPFPRWWTEAFRRAMGLTYRSLVRLRLWWVDPDGGYYRDGHWTTPTDWYLTYDRFLDRRHVAERQRRGEAEAREVLAAQAFRHQTEQALVEEGWTW